MKKYELDINFEMEKYLHSNEMAGAALIVSKFTDEVYRNKWGYADIEGKTPTQYDTIYRLASMTKPITAVAIMQLIEQGKLKLEDPISKFLNEYEKPEVSALTVRDLLSHSSGMGMGPVGLEFANKSIDKNDNLEIRVRKWSKMPLDFQPGTETGYSPLVGFDILGRLTEVISGMDYQEYLRSKIFQPMGIKDITFQLSEEQHTRAAKLYSSENNKHVLIPEGDSLWQEVNPGFAGYFSGAAGLSGSVEDYHKFTSMLANNGEWKGVRILAPETVYTMQKRGAANILDSSPGSYWGLGMRVFKQPELDNLKVAPGTYGWSGAYGTHMFIHPASGLSATFVMNRTNIGGAGSPIARKVEELVFGIL